MTFAKDLWPVAVFAHNEEADILRCLDSIYAAAPGQPVQIYVLANGCSDRTEQLVSDYAQSHPGVHLVSIAVGDKANAWNHYVHTINVESDVHFFIDGDVRASAGALVALKRALREQPFANAAAAYPRTGRNLEKWSRSMQEDGWLAGNLYALRGDFIDRIRTAQMRLPVGWIIEDGLVGALAKWNLDPRGGAWDAKKIAACLDAGFEFDSLSWLEPANWRLYWRRRIRYSEGFFQNRMLRPFVKADGLAGLPATARELYLRSSEVPRARSGLNRLFDSIALGRIRRARAASG